MGCQCHQIGGPFIGADPSCPRHGDGGTAELEDTIDSLRYEIEQLKKDNKDLQERVLKLEKFHS